MRNEPIHDQKIQGKRNKMQQAARIMKPISNNKKNKSGTNLQSIVIVAFAGALIGGAIVSAVLFALFGN